MRFPGNRFQFIQHENAPIPSSLEVIQETEKAVKVSTPSGRAYWLPLSALKLSESLEGVYTFKPWFKKKKDCPNIY